MLTLPRTGRAFRSAACRSRCSYVPATTSRRTNFSPAEIACRGTGKARALVEASGDPWFILSAEHGLLAPEKVIEPYERTLNTMSVTERRGWAQQVQKQLEETIPDVGEVVVLAGNRYRENLMPCLRGRSEDRR